MGAEDESSRQVHQMVNFILNESKDKVEEIDARTLEEFNVERVRVSAQMKEKIANEYQKKRKQADVQRAIARSTAINRSRLEKIEARQQFMTQLRDLCTKELVEIAKTKEKYGTYLVDLIVQGCLRLMEDRVVVRCRQADEALVRQCLDAASRKYAQTVFQSTGAQKSVTLTTDKEVYLDAASTGGVQLLCQNNTIKVDNTLDKRLSLCMESDLPNIRKIIFPS